MHDRDRTGGGQPARHTVRYDTEALRRAEAEHAEEFVRFAASQSAGAAPIRPAMTGTGGGGEGGHIRARALHGRDEADDEVAGRRSLSRETTRAGRRLSPERSVNGNRARTMLPRGNT